MNPALIEQLLSTGKIDPETFETLMQALSGGTGAVTVTGNNYGNANSGLQVFINAAKAEGASPEAQRQGYLAQVLSQCNVDVLLGGDDADHHLKLHQLYTPLWTDWRPSALWIDRKEGFPPPPSALEFIGGEHRRCVLLGGPGSGKSSLAHMLVASMAAEQLGRATPQLGLGMLRQGLPKEDDDTPTPQAWAHGPLLPVWVVLRELAVCPRPAGAADARWVWQHLEAKLSGWGMGDYLPHLKTQLQEQGGLIVLDGLDEVSDAAQHREHLRQAVQCFADALPHCRVLVTSRPYAYQDKAWQLEGFEVARLTPLSRPQIAHFARAWYGLKAQAQVLSATEAQACQQRLLAEVDRNPRFSKLAAEPLLLTLIAQVQTASKGELPKQRFDLYERTVTLLLNQWERTKTVTLDDSSVVQQPSLSEFLRVGPEVLRANIEALAFEVHRDQHLPPPPDEAGWTANAPGNDEEAAEPPCADISGSALREALCRGLGHDRDIKPGQLEDYLRHRAGLLAQHDDAGQVYRFPHRSFQEFLAACHACDLPNAPEDLVRLACDDPGRWTEVLLLAAAKLERGSKNGPWTLADELCQEIWPQEQPSTRLLNGASLAGLVMLDRTLPADQAQLSDYQAAKRKNFIQAQLQLLSHPDLPAPTRASAGRALAHMGDPRPEVMTLDGMKFALVPAGRFYMGDDDWAASTPVHVHEIDEPFLIGIHPVSRAQWNCFSRAIQLNSRSSAELGYLPPNVGAQNIVATYVNWFQANAFCKWLTYKWAHVLPPGYKVSLPSEAEWEMAARGASDVPEHPLTGTVFQLDSLLKTRFSTRLNPLAKLKRCFDNGNVELESLGVEDRFLGVWPRLLSPYGTCEMHNFVWHWTRSLWGAKQYHEGPEYKYPYSVQQALREDEEAPSTTLRVVRGKAFHATGLRFAAPPKSHVGDFGFRVVIRKAAA